MRGHKNKLFAMAVALLVSACAEPEVILPGERLDIRADLDRASLQAQPEAVSTRFSPPPATRRADWPQRMGGATHNPGHPALSQTPRMIWSAQIGAGNSRRNRITADPIVADGRVFTVDSGARVMAHDRNGAALWSRDLTNIGDRPTDASGAGLAYDNGKLFVATGFGDLYALDARSGAQLWQQSLEASASGTPTVFGDLVYVVGRDNRAWAVDIEDGRVRWNVDGLPSASGVSGGASPAVNDRIAILPFSSGEIVGVLRQGGVRVWGATVAGGRKGQVYGKISDISGVPIIVGDRVYISNPQGRTVALEVNSGTRLWTANDGALSPVHPIGGSVFLLSDRNELVRLDADTGQRVWGTELSFFTNTRAVRRKAIYAHYGPILAGGLLRVASSDAILRSFDPQTGEQVGQVQLPDGATTNPIVAGDTLYVVTAKGQLVAYR